MFCSAEPAQVAFGFDRAALNLSWVVGSASAHRPVAPRSVHCRPCGCALGATYFLHAPVDSKALVCVAPILFSTKTSPRQEARTRSTVVATFAIAFACVPVTCCNNVPASFTPPVMDVFPPETRGMDVGKGWEGFSNSEDFEPTPCESDACRPIMMMDYTWKTPTVTILLRNVV